MSLEFDDAARLLDPEPLALEMGIERVAGNEPVPVTLRRH